MGTIVITGGSGFVGSHLQPALAAAGHDVRPLSIRAGVRPDDVAGADAVVHLAGESVAGRWTTAKRDRILASRRDGTRSLVDAIVAAGDSGPRTLVSASAVGYYGERGEDELAEDAGPGDGFLAGVCTAWEAEAQRAAGHGVRVVTPRFGIILARDAEAYRRLRLPASLGLGGPLGSGRQWWPWVHVDDVVGIVAQAIDDDRYTGAVNVTAPAPERQRDVARALGGVLRRPAFLPAPAFALKALLGGFSAELLTSRRAVPRRAEELGYRFAHPTLDHALRAIEHRG